MPTKLKVTVSNYNEKDHKRTKEIRMKQISDFIKHNKDLRPVQIMDRLRIPNIFLRNHVICFKCGHIEEKATYAIAQVAMGHAVTFTCDCGNKINC